MEVAVAAVTLVRDRLPKAKVLKLLKLRKAKAPRVLRVPRVRELELLKLQVLKALQVPKLDVDVDVAEVALPRDNSSLRCAAV